MAALQIQLEVTGLDAAIARLDAAGRALEGQELADSLGVLGVGQTQRRIQSEKTTPEGAAWKPNLEGTSILERSGLLGASMMHHVADAHTVMWGPASSGRVGLYARVHQFGATIRPVNAQRLAFSMSGKKVFAKQVTIPAREYLGVSEANARELTQTAETFVGGLFS